MGLVQKLAAPQWIGLLGASFVLAAAAPASAQPGRDYTDNIQRRSALDAELQRAQVEAQQSLPIIRRHFAEHPGGPADHAVEVLFHTPSGIDEGIWVGELKRKGKQVSGSLADKPDRMPGYHMGSPVTFDENQIVDWMYLDGGKHYGYFSTRVLVKLHPEEAARLKADLWDSPLPPEATRKH
jgi:uncharacterized protein YegJ (DUF2314 family)